MEAPEIVDQGPSRSEFDILRRSRASTTDKDLVAALLRGNEGAFVDLFNDLQPGLLRLARNHLPSWSIAEEVAQETWLAVLEGLYRFEFRCSLKTWVYSILLNRARRRGEREHRFISSSSMEDPAASVDPEYRGFEGQLDRSSNRGHWSVVGSQEYRQSPEDRLIMAETLGKIEEAVGRLPPTQRNVIILRDTLGWTSSEVARLLHLTDCNERVLLHRARKSVQTALRPYLTTDDSETP